MVLEFFVDTGYSVVEHSWRVSTVLVKYLLVVQFASFLGSKGFEELGVEDFKESLLIFSAPSVSLIVLLGSLSFIASFSAEPLFFPVFSEFLAWLYFAYLFWEF